MTADATPAGRALRALPSVDALTRRLVGRPEVETISRPRLTATVRSVLELERRRVSTGAAASDHEALIRRVLDALRPGGFSLRPVINATGVVLHTNLGRALLSPL